MPLPPSLRGLLRTTPSLAPVPHRALISVTGSQAAEFLQGVLSSSVPSPPKPFYSAFLHAQGRVLYDVLVYTQTDPKGQTGFLIEHDPRPSEAPPLLALLKRFILRSKVRVRDVSDEYTVWAAWGSESHRNWDTSREWAWAKSGVVEPTWPSGGAWPWGSEQLAMQDRRAPGMGARLLWRTGDKPSGTDGHDVLGPQDYTLHRVLNGVPEGSQDIVPLHAFPMESNIDLMDGVDFRKGCYVGQELTVRTYHTGQLRKRIVPVMLQTISGESLTSEATEMLPKDIEIRPDASTNGGSAVRSRGAGKLLTRLNGVGLGLLRLDHFSDAINGSITLRGESSGGPVQVVPWRPDWWPNEPEPESEPELSS